MSVVRRRFDPSRNEIWRKLSEALQGRFVKGGLFEGDKVEVDHDEWTVTLDSYVVTNSKAYIPFTRMRAPFVNPVGFRFQVYRKSIFSGLGKLFGMQDVEVGDAPFDEEFIVQATDEPLICRLLASPTIRGLIETQKDITLSVKDDEGWFGRRFPDGVDELYFVAAGTIKDLDRLKLLYDLFAETLDELCRIGAAEKAPPNVTVR
jgi:hypothetical protein